MDDPTLSELFDLRECRRFRVDPGHMDRMPIGTVLIGGSPEPIASPQVCFRVVQPIDPSKYPAQKLTPNKRLLYYFWSAEAGAKKALGQAVAKTFIAIIQPGSPGWVEIDGFKTLCDHRRGHKVNTVLLEKALELALT